MFCTIQFPDAVPSIRWDDLQAPAIAIPFQGYAGHLPGSGVQRHSADALYAQHGCVLRAVGGCNGRLIWQALNRAGVVVAAHPRHDSCALLAHAYFNGA